MCAGGCTRLPFMLIFRHCNFKATVFSIIENTLKTYIHNALLISVIILHNKYNMNKLGLVSGDRDCVNGQKIHLTDH